MSEFESFDTRPHRSEAEQEASVLPKAVTERYLHCEQVAQHGQARLFKGTDSHFLSDVAIKVLTRPIDATVINRWRRLSILPTVVPVLDAQIDDHGCRVAVMPWIEGRQLQELVRSSFMDDEPRSREAMVRELLTQLAELARDVAEANRWGVVHNDIKAANVLVSNDRRRIWLVDWTSNVAPPATHESQLESPSTLGTRNERSDETRDGSKYIEAADGVMLARLVFFLLTGEHLPDDDAGAARAVMRASIDSNAVDPSQLRGLLRATLAKQLTTDAFATQLGQVIDRKLSIYGTKWTRFRSVVSQRWTLTCLTVIAASLLVTATTMFFRAWEADTRAELARSAQKGAEHDAEVARRDRAQLSSELDRTRTELSEINRSAEARRGGRDDLALFLLEKVARPEVGREPDNAIWTALLGDAERLAGSAETPSDTRGVLYGLLGKSSYFVHRDHRRDQADARIMLRKALHAAAESGDFDPRLLIHLRHYLVLASLNDDAAVLREAETPAEQNVAESRSCSGGRSLQTLDAMHALGDVKLQLGKTREAIGVFEQVFAAKTSAFPERKRSLGLLKVKIARAHEDLRELEAAEAAAMSGVDLMREAGLDSTGRYLLVAEADLIRLRMQLGRKTGVIEKELRDLIPRFERGLGPTDANTVGVKNFLVILLINQGRPTDAAEVLDEMLSQLPDDGAQLDIQTELALLNTQFALRMNASEFLPAAMTFSRAWARCADLRKTDAARIAVAVKAALLAVLSDDTAVRRATLPAIEFLKGLDEKDAAADRWGMRTILLAELAMQRSDLAAARQILTDLSGETRKGLPRWLQAWLASIAFRLGETELSLDDVLERLASDPPIPPATAYLKKALNGDAGD